MSHGSRLLSIYYRDDGRSAIDDELVRAACARVEFHEVPWQSSSAKAEILPVVRFIIRNTQRRLGAEMA